VLRFAQGGTKTGTKLAAVLLYGVVSAETEKALEFFVHREDAAGFLEDVRRDDAELADLLRVEPVELET